MAFIGRENELNEIVNFLTKNNNGFISISGDGGIGKSVLVNQVISVLCKKGITVPGVIDFSEARN